jgi:fimbrial isopeptide formation D2 family protein/uncharacterized repeat protein (TIGR02543 family)
VLVNGKNPAEATGPSVVVTDPIDDLRKLVQDPETGEYTGETVYTDDGRAALSYRIEFLMPEDTTSMGSIEVLDEMPAGMALTGSAVASIKASVDGGGAVEGTASYDAATNTAKFEISASGGLAKYAGKTIMVDIAARLTGEVTGTLFNIGKVLVNGKNPYRATGPSVVVTEPVKDVKKLVQDPDTGKYTDGKIYTDDGRAALSYRIEFLMPGDTTSMESIEMYDRMPAGMALTGSAVASIKASVKESGAAVAGTASYDAATNTAKFALSTSGGLAQYESKTIVVDIAARLTGEGAGALVNRAEVVVNYGNPYEATGPAVVVTDPIEGLEKKVYDASEGGYADRLELAAGGGDVLEYRIAFRLPEDMTSYGSITIEDIMPDGLEYAGGEDSPLSVSAGGADITALGTASVSGGKVSFELVGEGYLAGLAGLEVEMRVKALVSGSFGTGVLVNTARVLVNGKTPAIVTGPPVIVTDQTPGAIRDLKKEIYSDIKGAYVDFINITDHEATLDYLISFKMPADVKGYKTIELQDLLPESLTLAGLLADSVTITVNGAVVADGGQLAVKYPDSGGGVISYVFDPAAIQDLADAEIAMRVFVNIVPGTANGSIANKGRVLINDDPDNPTLPDDEPKDPSEQTDGPEVNIVDEIEDLAKLVWDGEKYVYELPAIDRTQVLEYQISFRIPTDIGGYKSIEIQDLMPAALELAGTLEESVVVHVNGITTAGLLAVKYADIGGGTISYSFDEASIGSLAGAEVTMKISTKINDSAEDGATISNIGRVLINDDPRDPTTPDDTPSKPSEETKGPDVTPRPVYTVTFNGNGGSVSSPSYRMAYYPDYHVPSLPSANRAGYRLTGWNFAANGSGGTFTQNTTVDADITVYAQWQINSGDGEPEPGGPDGPDPSDPIVVDPPTGGEDSTEPPIVPVGPPVIIPDEAPPAAPAPPPARPTPPRPGEPVVIGDSDVPLAEPPIVDVPLIPIPDSPVPPAQPPVWALLNLLLAVLGGLIAVMLLATAIRRRDEDSYNIDEESRKDRRRRNIWRTLGVLAGLAGIITFVLTENIHNIMVLTDKWTPLMIVIEVAVLVFTYLVYHKEGKRDSGSGSGFEPANPGLD